ncbi:hypothetical protein [Cryptosporangium sp. NPDC051539]|uniref:hypothetical protein n=1 Tax=Cryptosporangium sp. NPDC051539 TaxID=3363962 RepID=UPI0037945FDC
MSLPLCVLALSFGTAIGAARGSCRCASALVALAVVWVLGNGAMEGHVLWTMDSDHGLTLADLLTIPMLALGGWRLGRSAEAQAWFAARAAPGESAWRPRMRFGVAAHRAMLTRLAGRRAPFGPRSAARLSDAGRAGAPSSLAGRASHGMAGGAPGSSSGPRVRGLCVSLDPRFA